MTAPKIWRKIPEYYSLIGNKCAECSALFFPAKDVCSHCDSERLTNYKFDGKGKIQTFTIIRTPTLDPSEEGGEIVARFSPYVLAIIQLDQGPSITTEIVDCSLEQVQIGKSVETVFRKILQEGSKGVIHYGYKFRLAR